MPSEGKFIITNTGDARLSAALGTETAVEITHVALGDGNGAVYDPGYGQAELKNELARVPIKRRHFADDNAWRITAEFNANETPAFWVREIGFFDAEGDLIFLWAGTDISPRQTGAVDYLLDKIMTLDRVKDGVVVIGAQDDEVFDTALTNAIALGNLQHEQLRQADQIRFLMRAN